MSECVIVAVPRADDYTHKISSEKIPHMTLLYLGEVNDGPTMAGIASFVEHASEDLDRFGLNVDRRGTLGDDAADVLFFKASYTKKIEDFRKNLLMNNDIRAAYETAMQYPQWTPHLTLGYPDAPAKEIDREYGINWVEFDRIAVWFGDFEGPEFQLEDNAMLYVDEVAYSDIEKARVNVSDVDDFLAHYGVKGMRWGKRKSETSGSGGAPKVNERKLQKAQARSVKTKARIEAELKGVKYDDESIKTARSNIKKADADYQMVRAEARVLRQTEGRAAVKKAIKQGRFERDLAYIRNQDQAEVKTTGELVEKLLGNIGKVVIGTAETRRNV